MNIFEMWIGSDMYDFSSPPQNHRHQTNVSPDLVASLVKQGKDFVKHEQVLWSLCTLLEIDPETGQTKLTTWHEKGTPKTRLVLNERAKVKKATKVPWGWGGPDPFPVAQPAVQLDELLEEMDEE